MEMLLRCGMAKVGKMYITATGFALYSVVDMRQFR